MSDQVPYSPGLEEQLDQLFITQLGTAFKKYTSQQRVPLPVDLRGIYNKQDEVTYPFVGVLTMSDMVETNSIGDIFEVDSQTGYQTLATINEIKVALLLQTEDIRELQRLTSWIKLNLMWGSNPVNSEPFSWIFQKNGVVITGWEQSDVQRVGFESILQRTQNAQGKELLRRPDVETLWEIELKACCLVQTSVLITTTDGVIEDINFNFQIEYNPS